MFNKIFVQIDRDLLVRFVEAIERIAPPVETPVKTISTEDDLIDMTDEEYNRKSVQWELDDLAERIRAKGGANEEELKGLEELRAIVVEEGLEEREDDDD